MFNVVTDLISWLDHGLIRKNLPVVCVLWKLYLTLVFDTIHTVFDTSIIAMVMYSVGVLISSTVLLFDSSCIHTC